MTTEGQYKKVSLLGSGQSAQVWLAVGSDGNVVSLKCFSDKDEALAEYERGAKLSHPHLLQPISLLEDDPSVLVMPYCEGRSMDNLAGFLSEKDAWQLLMEMADALSFLHQKGLCHPGIKPSKILWDGQSFLLADAGGCLPAGEPRPLGGPDSLPFIPPERERSPKSDIWSLGATLFHLILGTHVFNGLGGGAQRPDSPLPFLRKGMPELSSLICRCLAYNPSDRPTAEELLIQAQDGLKKCQSRKTDRPLKVSDEIPRGGACPDFWPDEMKEP